MVFYMRLCRSRSVFPALSASWIVWCNNFHQSRSNDICHLCLFKDLLLLVAVEVDPNGRPVTTCPAESVDDSRTIREDYAQTLR